MDFIGSVWYFCCGWIIIGALAGGLARYLLRRPDKSLVNDIILGVIGAFVGGIVVSVLGFGDNLDIGFGIGSLVTAIIGAAILIVLGDFITGRRR